MYLDSSLRKMAVLFLVMAVMFVSLTYTSQTKERWYGQTPPFASIGIAFQEIMFRTWYAFESAAWRMQQLAGASSVFLFNSTDFARTDEKRQARAIPVLTYHRIVGNENDLNNVTIARFRDQMLALKRAGWETITLKEYFAFMRGEIELPERSFLITFDDGAKESFYPVDPLFQALGYEGVMYIIAAAAHTPESIYYLSPPEIRRMLGTGRWEIGSHSYDGHRPYPAGLNGTESGIFFADLLWREGEKRDETPEEFTKRVHTDLARADMQLEQEYDVVVDSFAFPLGNETGIEGAANFPEGATITEREASTIYDVGFLQTNNQQYTFNYPVLGFTARRIHVDYDWDGERLLRELEQGLEKELPFADDFSENHGWIPSWGSVDLGRNNMQLSADTNISSASTFLDGSALWDNYSFDAAVNWTAGSVFLLADVTNSKTYHSCAFSEGLVRAQSTVNGETKILAEKKDDRITFGNDRRPGVRVHGSVIECTWNYDSLVESYERTRTGGIGVQVWNPELGTASLQVSEILVRPYSTSTPNEVVL